MPLLLVLALGCSLAFFALPQSSQLSRGRRQSWLFFPLHWLCLILQTMLLRRSWKRSSKVIHSMCLLCVPLSPPSLKKKKMLPKAASHELPLAASAAVLSSSCSCSSPLHSSRKLPSVFHSLCLVCVSSVDPDQSAPASILFCLFFSFFIYFLLRAAIYKLPERCVR